MENSLRTVTVCGLPILAASYSDTVAELARRVRDGVGARVVTLNLEMIARSRRDSEYANWIRSADLILADGMPVVWAMKRRAGTLPVERIAGVDLTADLLRVVEAERIGIIGGENPRATLDKLKIPGSDRIGINSSRLAATDDTIDAIAREMTGRSLIFLALGVPKQDIFAIGLRSRIPQAVLIPNGGSFELLAGQKKRAPQWMQRLGGEWLFRLCVEPRRLWRRYLVEYWGGVVGILLDRPI
ncbi:MAG: WecB/TagA/CpsF family glycosyltransferase [Fimbriimonadaceae bacterium]|nr:WecB/TagA/CpsF family glycosyltransferase [Fimbriimonadaceae bacterium]